MHKKFKFNSLPSRFAPGFPCYMKAKKAVGVIKKAMGPKEWLVVEVDENGDECGVEAKMTSRQLRRMRRDESHPLIIKTSPEESSIGGPNRSILQERSNEADGERGRHGDDVDDIVGSGGDDGSTSQQLRRMRRDESHPLIIENSPEESSIGGPN